MEQQEPKLDDMDMGEEDEDEEYDENGYSSLIFLLFYPNKL